MTSTGPGGALRCSVARRARGGCRRAPWYVKNAAGQSDILLINKMQYTCLDNFSFSDLNLLPLNKNP